MKKNFYSLSKKKVNEILTKRYGIKISNRISHKEFLLSLKNSKISVGALDGVKFAIESLRL